MLSDFFNLQLSTCHNFGNMKRGRGDTLTGGTNDVNPQLLTFPSLFQASVNTFVELKYPLPINRYSARAGKSVVFEVLKCYLNGPILDTNPSAGGNRPNATLQLSTRPAIAVDNSDPACFAYLNNTWNGAFTAGGSYQTMIQEPTTIDLTDGAGHGFLVATDAIYLQGNTTAFAGPGTWHVKILYRFKEVKLEEYIGIVQSQS